MNRPPVRHRQVRADDWLAPARQDKRTRRADMIPLEGTELPSTALGKLDSSRRRDQIDDPAHGGVKPAEIEKIE
jgi:hypothetical protein